MPLYIEPHAGPAPVVQVIQSARHNVSVEVYYLASRPILNALRAAHNRGVNVRVILDKHPYGMRPWQVRKEAREVEVTGAKLHWAPPRFEADPAAGRYVFMHAKVVASNHEAEIGTANLDWSAWHRNRELLYDTRDPAVVKAANMVFNADWNNRRAGNYPHRILVLSPGSEAKLQSVIDQPGPIEIESEEMGNDRAMLDAIAAKGRLARVILPASISAQDKRNVAWLESKDVQVRLMPVKPIYIHCKDIVSNTEAFVGSENFSVSSLNRNREAGLILDGRPVRELQAQFNRDWARAG
ncbi:GTP-binding protein [Acidithiobacillus ferridurans]|uniref:phospholipase D-like domain-containing protein n=1 Tax=Acidithiobacillus ferridurans TaxID=1232575 RepID=UPI000DE4DD1C|nr:phospholipase D-like domain-containing protein [Acidithiobacillus ferridurans]RBL99115.1 GTP-binding protein [Acidithiobacillus ferridurans]